MSRSLLAKQLKTLRSCILHKPPYRSGIVSLPPEQYVLFYGKERDARRIDLANCSDEELQELNDTCDVATFGRNHENVHDETYRRAGKLDSAHFSVKVDLLNSGLLDLICDDLLDDHYEERRIRAEMYKLNVYGKDSFFKPHVDTPRGQSMFGTLVIVFPPSHDGGSLILRHHDEEWTFDSGRMLSEQQEPSLAYVMFFSDVEHEVMPVKSGYRVTVTYNLYFSQDRFPAPSAMPLMDTSALELKTAFQMLLDDPTFLPQGGRIAFALSHRYPIDVVKQSIGTVARHLKGRDAKLRKICRQLSLATDLRAIFDDNDVLVMTEECVAFDAYPLEQDNWSELREYGGKLITKARGSYLYSVIEPDEIVHWANPADKKNYFQTPYVAEGNEATLNYTYGFFCLLVTVGPPGQRSMEPEDGGDTIEPLTGHSSEEASDGGQATDEEPLEDGEQSADEQSSEDSGRSAVSEGDQGAISGHE